jgi:hypothetical protein
MPTWRGVFNSSARPCCETGDERSKDACTSSRRLRLAHEVLCAPSRARVHGPPFVAAASAATRRPRVIVRRIPAEVGAENTQRARNQHAISTQSARERGHGGQAIASAFSYRGKTANSDEGAH